MRFPENPFSVIVTHRGPRGDFTVLESLLREQALCGQSNVVSIKLWRADRKAWQGGSARETVVFCNRLEGAVIMQFV